MILAALLMPVEIARPTPAPKLEYASPNNARTKIVLAHLSQPGPSDCNGLSSPNYAYSVTFGILHRAANSRGAAAHVQNLNLLAWTQLRLGIRSPNQ
jgi:hypothetical protein